MKRNERWIKLGDWFNKNKIPIYLITFFVLIMSAFDSIEKKVIPEQPLNVTYREYLNDLEEGKDKTDEEGNIIAVPDKIDTVYYDLSSEEWRYTVWTEESRAEYENWIAKGKASADFKYNYSKSNWRIVTVSDFSYDKIREHIDEYAGVSCRDIIYKSFRPVYFKYLQAFGSTLLMFAFILTFFGIYAKKMQNMGSLKKEDIFVKDVKVKFADVIGHDEIKDDLKLIVNLIKAARAEQEAEKKNGTSQIPEKSKFNADIPKGMLFSGAAGTGKTMLAKAVAGEAGVPFLMMDASGMVEQYVGLGAKRVREIFKLARKNAPCIIFVDEIDAVGLDRNSNINSEQKQTINALLAEMDGFKTKKGIFIIAATNNPDSLDKALVRSGRFDRQVVIGPPKDYKERSALFEMYLKDDKCTADIAAASKQCVGFTGADIKAICNDARLIAIAGNADSMTSDILEEAIDRKLFKGNRTKNKVNDEIKTVAHHEAGHALMSYLLGAPIARATIQSNTSGVGGAVIQGDNMKQMISKKEAENKIMIAYGGRAAEELIFGKEEITTGAVNDIELATDIIKNTVSILSL